MCIIIDSLYDLICKGELFVSEMDFQFHLALILKGKEANNIIFNYPIKTSELYKKYKGKMYHDSFNNKHIDLYFIYNGEEYFVELKYKTDKYKINKGEKSFLLVKQMAYSDNFYSVYKDIERMENLRRINPKYKTYVLCLTNDSYYWENHLKGKVGTFNLFEKTKIIEIKDLYLEKSYDIEWKKFNNEFKYLLIDLNV